MALMDRLRKLLPSGEPVYGPEDFGCDRKHLHPLEMAPETPWVKCPDCGQPLHPDEVKL